DGTDLGTVPVMAFPNVGGKPPGVWILAADRLIATDRSGALWVSDGTPGGTELIGSPVIVSAEVVVLDGVAYFSGHRNGAHHLWRTDGTLPGTEVVNPGQVTNGLTALDGSLYYQADNQIWMSDGTP